MLSADPSLDRKNAGRNPFLASKMKKKRIYFIAFLQFQVWQFVGTENHTACDDRRTHKTGRKRWTGTRARTRAYYNLPRVYFPRFVFYILFSH